MKRLIALCLALFGLIIAGCGSSNNSVENDSAEYSREYETEKENPTDTAPAQTNETQINETQTNETQNGKPETKEKEFPNNSADIFSRGFNEYELVMAMLMEKQLRFSTKEALETGTKLYGNVGFDKSKNILIYAGLDENELKYNLSYCFGRFLTLKQRNQIADEFIDIQKKMAHYKISSSMINDDTAKVTVEAEVPDFNKVNQNIIKKIAEEVRSMAQKDNLELFYSNKPDDPFNPENNQKDLIDTVTLSDIVKPQDWWLEHFKIPANKDDNYTFQIIFQAKAMPLISNIIFDAYEKELNSPENIPLKKVNFDIYIKRIEKANKKIVYRIED
ncbi:MAG: hypothetical protein IJT73_01225, partial [Selenomonadaceae bacterium]|nr:hypothetical protein [Selenomonadaceae bacterium]